MEKDKTSLVDSRFKIDDLKERILILTSEIKQLEKEKLIKSTQLASSDALLEDIQSKILENNQKISKIELAQDENSKEGKQSGKFLEDRDMQEIDKKLKEKLSVLAKKRQFLLPTPLPSLVPYIKQDAEIMIVHTIKILYPKGMKDGETLKLNKENPLEVSVRLLKATTFAQIKLYVCEFWELEPNHFSLRANNFALIEHLQEPVETLIKNQKLRPEFWIIENNKNAYKSLTMPEDYYTEESKKNKTDGGNNKKKELDKLGKIANYEAFLDSFEGLKTFLPKKPSIDDLKERMRLEDWGLNIFTFTTTVLVLIITIVINFGMGDFSTRYWIASQMYQDLHKSFK